MAFKINDERAPLDQFLQGESVRAYEFLGSHFVNWDGRQGVVFRVWAPNALSVSVVGDFNDWNNDANFMYKISDGGVWELFIEGIPEFACYKYCVETPWHERRLKTDPYAFHCQTRPDNASRVYEINGYEWHDEKWYDYKKEHPHKNMPINVYEVNAGSWRKYEDGNVFSYRKLADELIPYVKNMGYTHIEFMPLTEYPFDGSWGYQVTGYFAATSRYGEPKDLMYFVDRCHEEGIGVILDWVPAHFPKDAHGLGRFDGTGCYEYEDPRIGEHKEWGTYIFNYGRYEVTSFLLSSAMFWLDKYHVDGIRVDAVASMLYLDYNRKDGEWIANAYGGRENLVAVDFLQKLNTVVHMFHPEAMMIAEESTAWPNVTRYPIKDMGLGFDYKWNMGWMNDTLRYMGMDPYFRKDNHSLLTFMMMYAYSENYILPLSHDEVVHGKGSMLNKMFGEYDEKFAAYRTLLGYYMTMPGKKMLFMGGEFGQMLEWRYDDQLEWNVLEIDKHKRLHQYVKDLNHFYMENKALWELDTSWDGFRWVNEADSENSVLSYIRRGRHAADNVVVVANFTPVERPIYKIGVPLAGEYEVVFHSSAVKYGGNKRITKKVYKTKNMQFSDMMYTIEVAIDGNSVMFLKKKPADKAAASKKKTTASKTAKKTTDKTESATAKKAAVKKTTATKTAAKKTSTRTNKSAK